MIRELLHAKIHRLTITDANPEYEGSITIDNDLLEAANIREFEKVHVADVTNGARFQTYTMRGTPGSGVVCVNGAAAKLVSVGDIIIVMDYVFLDEQEVSAHKPKIVLVDRKNSIKDVH